MPALLALRWQILAGTHHLTSPRPSRAFTDAAAAALNASSPADSLRTICSIAAAAATEWRIWVAAAADGLRRLEAAAPCLKEGGAVVMDARCLHRALPNRSAPVAAAGRGPARAALIFRYDKIESPPPGHTSVTAAAVAAAGTLLLTLVGRRRDSAP